MGNIMHQYAPVDLRRFDWTKMSLFLVLTVCTFEVSCVELSTFIPRSYTVFGSYIVFFQNDLIMCSLGLGESNLEE